LNVLRTSHIQAQIPAGEGGKTGFCSFPKFFEKKKIKIEKGGNISDINTKIP
jgi:hypothetical protein